MDLTGIGSLGMYTKSLRLKTQWDLKKSSGDVNSHDSLNDMLKKTQTAALYQSQIDEANAQGEDRMQTIMGKLNAGKKLTTEEKQYLQARNPQLYQMVQSADEEQKAYEREMRQCRTKEEAQRVRMAHMNSSLTRIKAIEHNPAIPDDKKQELYAVENYRNARLDASTKRFIRRGEYAKLPTELEKAKAEKEETEEKEESGEAREVDGKEKVTKEETAKTETTKTETAKAESPEERKVRRAKARAAYAAYSGAAEEEDLSPADGFSVETRA